MRLDEAARTFLGVPFQHQKRDPSIGLDCIGLAVLSGRMLSLPFVELDRTDYGTEPTNGVLESYLRVAFGPPVPKASIQPGDIVAIDYAGAIRHLGIVGEHPQGGLSLIHTNSKVGRVTEAGINAKWLKRIKQVYRVET